MGGEFKLILGPMASSKSSTLIAEMERYDYARQRTVTVQPDLNVRDKQIESRNGLKREAIKLKRLGELLTTLNLDQVDVVGIDEAFMFEADDAKESIAALLKLGKTVVASSLDIMANGHVPKTVIAMQELAPNVTYVQAVCTHDGCGSMNARMTVIYDLKSGQQITNLPDVVPDDGSYGYRPVCRDHYYGWRQ